MAYLDRLASLTRCGDFNMRPLTPELLLESGIMARHDWMRDELILALDLYFREPSARGSKNHPEVIALSEVLNRLPLHPPGEREDFFRNANGVGMKLSNFLRLDPEYEGKGLQRGSHLEEEVWEDFVNDRDQLASVASAIRATAVGAYDGEDFGDPEEYEATEGRILYRMHRRRERDPSLVQRKKTSVREANGALLCEVCGFDFEATYGELGRGFAECHHLVPLANLKPGSRTRLADLAILCANCHRMIHRNGGLTLSELRSTLQ